jgi:hypothetical protein
MKSIFLMLCLIWLWLSAAVGRVHAEALPEYTVKAAYLYNFALLTEWPPKESSNVINMCLYRNHDFGATIEKLRSKNVNNRAIQVIYIAEPEEARQCHMLVISALERYPMRQLMEAITDLPILTITDNAQLAESDMMIRILTENQHMIFQVNLGLAKRANINLSSRLLRVANKVIL